MIALIYIISGIFININLFYYLTEIVTNKWNIYNVKSLLIIINSVLITCMCMLFLNNYILLDTIQSYLYYLIGFYIFDLYYLYNYETSKELYIKILHHTLAICGIVLFKNVPIIASKLLLTEIVNIPLEIRFIAIRNDYKKKAVKSIMEILIYILFAIYRIMYPFKDYCLVCKKQPYYYCIIFSMLYILWFYWFILINIKVYKILSNIIKYM